MVALPFGIVERWSWPIVFKLEDVPGDLHSRLLLHPCLRPFHLRGPILLLPLLCPKSAKI